MFQWIFGTQRKGKKPLLPGDQDFWLYQFMANYLISPLWKNPILQFIDENCSGFEDTQQNKLQYTLIFKRLKSLLQQQLKNVMDQMKISQELFQRILRRGLNDIKKKYIFEQILVCDNFMVFKRTMIKRNKEIQLKILQHIDDKQKLQQAKFLQKANLQQAIAYSKALEEKSDWRQLPEEEREKRGTKLFQKPTLILNQGQLIKKRQLPPLLLKANYDKPLSTLTKERDQLQLQLQNQSKEQKLQDREQRKKRMKQQRDIIKNRMKLQRTSELKSYVDRSEPENKQIEEEQMQRRTALMKKVITS